MWWRASVAWIIQFLLQKKRVVEEQMNRWNENSHNVLPFSKWCFLSFVTDLDEWNVDETPARNKPLSSSSWRHTMLQCHTARNSIRALKQRIRSTAWFFFPFASISSMTVSLSICRDGSKKRGLLENIFFFCCIHSFAAKVIFYFCRFFACRGMASLFKRALLFGGEKTDRTGSGWYIIHHKKWSKRDGSCIDSDITETREFCVDLWRLSIFPGWRLATHSIQVAKGQTRHFRRGHCGSEYPLPGKLPLTQLTTTTTRKMKHGMVELMATATKTWMKKKVCVAV